MWVGEEKEMTRGKEETVISIRAEGDNHGPHTYTHAHTHMHTDTDTHTHTHTHTQTHSHLASDDRQRAHKRAYRNIHQHVRRPILGSEEIDQPSRDTHNHDTIQLKP